MNGNKWCSKSLRLVRSGRIDGTTSDVHRTLPLTLLPYFVVTPPRNDAALLFQPSAASSGPSSRCLTSWQASGTGFRASDRSSRNPVASCKLLGSRLEGLCLIDFCSASKCQLSIKNKSLMGLIFVCGARVTKPLPRPAFLVSTSRRAVRG